MSNTIEINQNEIKQIGGGKCHCFCNSPGMVEHGNSSYAAPLEAYKGRVLDVAVCSTTCQNSKGTINRCTKEKDYDVPVGSLPFMRHGNICIAH